jgi:hypothetical protein
MRLIEQHQGLANLMGAEMQKLIMQLENEWYRLK